MFYRRPEQLATTFSMPAVICLLLGSIFTAKLPNSDTSTGAVIAASMLANAVSAAVITNGRAVSLQFRIRHLRAVDGVTGVDAEHRFALSGQMDGARISVRAVATANGLRAGWQLGRLANIPRAGRMEHSGFDLLPAGVPVVGQDLISPGSARLQVAGRDRRLG